MPYKDKVKQKAYQLAWMLRRRQQWLKEHGPCVSCGNRDNLEVDHKNPTQKIDHRVWSWSDERREKELAKCQVLCKGCHAEKTAKSQRKDTHGRVWMYINGCRCLACKDAKSKSDKKYKGRLTER